MLPGDRADDFLGAVPDPGDFDPDKYLKYLAGKQKQIGSFDPDKYLAEKQQTLDEWDSVNTERLKKDPNAFVPPPPITDAEIEAYANKHNEYHDFQRVMLPSDAATDFSDAHLPIPRRLKREHRPRGWRGAIFILPISDRFAKQGELRFGAF